ncbi:MAG: response regulator [Bacteroidales bacterium]|nr:response regulator [Bacteroidales bacterium]
MAERKKIDILAVDDRVENLLAIESIIDSDEINLTKALSGNEALSLMFDYDFALVLMDVQMPGMDGFETAELMRGSDKTRHIPIIFITAINKEKKHIFRGYDAGAVDYIFKPFEPDILLSKVNVFIDLYLQRNTLEELTRKLETTISELIQSREQLKLSEEKYKDIFQNANEGIFILRNNIILFNNPKTEEILAGKSQNLLQKNFLDFIHPEFKRMLESEHFDKLRKKSHDKRTAIKIISGQEDIKWVEINSVNINWEGEKALLNFISDISERKQAEEEIKRAKNLAEQASRTKSEFLANMSHEIRTPLNGIIGMTELVLMSQLNEEQKERIEAVKYSGESLLDIINDILDISKIEARKLELDAIKFSLRGVIEKVLRPLASKTAAKNLELILDIQYKLHDTFIGDPVRLRQILFNLLGNAIKFTEEGEVKLSVKSIRQESDLCTLGFSISDTGIGIPDNKIGNLFKSFSQADNSTSRKFGGTGLGLVISKSLVEMMNGKVDVKSVEGKGSTFTFDITIQKSSSPGEQSDTEILPQLREKNVLIVDDNNTNRKILSGLLTNLNIQYELADNGGVAFDKILRQSRTNNPFDIILLDYHMPVMDGIEMAELLKRENKINPKPDIILLSSDDVSLKRSKLSSYGISRYMIKPVFRNDLIKVLNEVVSHDDYNTPIQKVLKPKMGFSLGKSYNVLLAEDNLINQKLANGLLQNLGCKVTIVDNGKKAVEIANENTFDIIFMDIQMPEMDGYEATGIIRDMEKTKGTHTPIIAMTAHAMKGDREKCINAGMDEYITKPISLKSLTDAIIKVNINPNS